MGYFNQARTGSRSRILALTLVKKGTIGMRLAFPLLLVALTTHSLTGCSDRQNDFRHKSNHSARNTSLPPTLPTVRGPDIGDLPKPGSAGSTQDITLDNGAALRLVSLGGTYFHEAEATVTEAAYRDILQNSQIIQVTEEIVAAITRDSETRILLISQRPEWGYFRFLVPYHKQLLSNFQHKRFTHELIINPVLIDRGFTPQSFTQPTEGASRDPRTDTRAFSGLDRIRVPEFLRLVNETVPNTPINGDQVKLGITDTGITFNHPTFLSLQNPAQNRITYMKDFTGEGRGYINPTARFTATALQGSEWSISADVLVAPKLPSKPTGDGFQSLNDLKIHADGALAQALAQSPASVRLGVIAEATLQGPGDEADLNGNGKLGDLFFFFSILGNTATDDVIYFDGNADRDFRGVVGMRSFEIARETQTVALEKIGFHIVGELLPDAQGTKTFPVRSYSIVGFDPGTHGTHVAGIAAGSRTLSNDPIDTLARGVAPEAQILMNRVCSNNGGCLATEAVIDLASVAGADVVNMSLGGLHPLNDGYGVSETIINRLSEHFGTLFVISAGNSGPGRQTIGSPSVARNSLSVGATSTPAMIQRQYQWPAMGSAAGADQEQDFLFFFSSRGPTAAGGFKPNVTAPGSELSSTQLNAAPGNLAGSMILWGTSMAAPTAAGAYALLLDAARKYNATHPQERPIPTHGLFLKEVLMSSARAFDVSKFDPMTGASSKGRYTWIDQGYGMINLEAAWQLLMEMQKESASDELVTSRFPQGVRPQYDILTAQVNPTGKPYDGSATTPIKKPAFGTGLYLSYSGEETVRAVHITRRIPDPLLTSEAAHELDRAVRSSFAQFELSTQIYGSTVEWIRPGALATPDCWETGSLRELTIVGRGAEVAENPGTGTGEIVGQQPSTLHVCLNRELIQKDLPPGDHGAIIEGYRKTAQGRERLPSFRIPVYITVPHRVLENATGYEVRSQVRSFDVQRHYVQIPASMSLVQITLEVPQKTKGVACSGIELMGLEGQNNRPFVPARSVGRISNCLPNGAPIRDATKRRLILTRANPAPGQWDLHILGFYPFRESQYTIKVDYVVAEISPSVITGSTESLTGRAFWTRKDASTPTGPSAEHSRYLLTGFESTSTDSITAGASVFVSGPQGVMRQYPATTTNLIIRTGQSAGNDIDLAVLQCSSTAQSPTDSSCTEHKVSGGSSDEEMVQFRPNPERKYVIRVDGFTVPQPSTFVASETVELPQERGTLWVGEQSPSKYEVAYQFDSEQIQSSVLLNHAWFTEGLYTLTGVILLSSETDLLLGSIPLKIKRPTTAMSEAP